MGRAKPLRPVIREMALAHELLVAVPNSWARFKEAGPGQWMGTGKVEIRAFDHDRQLAVLEWLLDAEWLESSSSTHTRTDRTRGERLLDLLERFGALDFAVPAQPPTVSSGAQGAGGFTINAHGEFTDRRGYPVEPNEVLIPVRSHHRPHGRWREHPPSARRSAGDPAGEPGPVRRPRGYRRGYSHHLPRRR